MTTSSDVYQCDVYKLFPTADVLMTYEPLGYVLEHDSLKIPFWATQDDPLKVQGCEMFLVKFLDGSPVAVRYQKIKKVLADMCPKCHRDLDFIKKVFGPEGPAMHARAHEKDWIVQVLTELKAKSTEDLIKVGLGNLIDYLKGN